MSNTSKHIWIIPDTNILGNKGTRQALISILRQFKDKNVKVGLTQIPIEESPKKDQSKQHIIKLSLYEILRKHFDEEGILYQQFMKKEELLSVLKNLEHCGLESVQKNDDKKFWDAMDLCCNLLNSENENCKGYCGEVYRVLGDILTLSAAYYLYYYQKEDKIVVVSNDRTMCATFNELVNELFKEEYHGKK